MVGSNEFSPDPAGIPTGGSVRARKRQMSAPRPIFSYLEGRAACEAARPDRGEARVVRHAGREGVNVRSIQGALELPGHTLAGARGSFSLWVMSLESLGVAAQYPAHRAHIPHAHVFPLLADAPRGQFDLDEAAFSLSFESHWHPQFYARWCRGPYYNAFREGPKAAICLTHFHFERLVWYQFAVTWDEEARDYRLYINGILAGTNDQHAEALARDPVGPAAYVGHPAWCVAGVRFYDEALTGEQVETLYAAEEEAPDPVVRTRLEAIYAGRARPFDWRPDEGWREELALPLDRAEDLEEFRVQGALKAPRITSEGLRITTPQVYYPHAAMPELGENGRHVYLWSRRVFEGDLYVTYEFQPLAPGGLGLFMAHCSGMQREDFMAEYPLSETDDMKYLFGGDVRNYHWEYWRDMNDTRNDVAGHGLMKNPFFRPLGYACRAPRLAEHRWHRLEYLQEGAHIRCVINGDVVIDANDAAFDNNGPVYSYGHIAIRCMITTDILLRGLRVMTRPQFEVV